MTTRTDDIAQRLGAVENRLTGVEASVTALDTAVQELRADLRETNRSIVQLNAEMNARFDRLFYTIIGIGGGVFAGLLGIIAALVVLILRIGGNGPGV